MTGDTNMAGIQMAPYRQRKPLETARFVLLVDRQAKCSFDERDDAEREAQKISSRFPHLHVTIEDSEAVVQRTGSGAFR
jgi:hypothetical protein